MRTLSTPSRTPRSATVRNRRRSDPQSLLGTRFSPYNLPTMDQQHLARQPPLSVSVVVELEKGTCNEEGLGAVVRACTRVLASDAKTCRIGSEHVSGFDGPCIQESPQCGGNPLTGETRPPGMSRGRVVNSHATPL